MTQINKRMSYPPATGKRMAHTHTHLCLDHEVSLMSHVEDEVEDVHLPFGIDHLHHGLNGDVGSCSPYSSARNGS